MRTGADVEQSTREIDDFMLGEIFGRTKSARREPVAVEVETSLPARTPARPAVVERAREDEREDEREDSSGDTWETPRAALPQIHPEPDPLPALPPPSRGDLILDAIDAGREVYAAAHPTTRRKRKKRANPARVIITERDRDILEFLAVAGVAGLEHIHHGIPARWNPMWGDTRKPTPEALRARLRVLGRHKFLHQHSASMGLGTVYAIADRGVGATTFAGLGRGVTIRSIDISLSHWLLGAHFVAQVRSGEIDGIPADAIIVPDSIITRSVDTQNYIPRYVPGETDPIQEARDLILRRVDEPGFFIPDFVLIDPATGLFLTSIEVECAVKSQERYQSLISSYEAAGRRADYIVGNTLPWLPPLKTIATRIERVRRVPGLVCYSKADLRWSTPRPSEFDRLVSERAAQGGVRR